MDIMKKKALVRAYQDTVALKFSGYLKLFCALNKLSKKLGRGRDDLGIVEIKLFGNYKAVVIPSGEANYLDEVWDFGLLLIDTGAGKYVQDMELPEAEYQKLLAYAGSPEFRKAFAAKAEAQIDKVKDLAELLYEAGAACAELDL